MSDLNEDIACIGEMLFSGDPTFWISVDRYDGLRAKVEMLSKYLSSLDPELNLDLFHLLPPSPFVARSSRFSPGELVYFPDGGKVVAPSEPLRVIAVPSGGEAIFPARSGVYFNLRSTALDPDAPKPVPWLPMPKAPNGYLVAPGDLGGWLIYAEGRGLDKIGGTDRLIYHEGDQIYFPFGGSIWMSDSAVPQTVTPGQIAIYPQNAVVVMNGAPPNSFGRK